MWQDYRWVAELDPAELADGAHPDDGSAGPGTEVVEVREVEHAGRPAWEALLRPTPRYQPRCTCCPLLGAPDVDRLECAAAGWDPPRSADGYTDVHRVRLDVGTGVCVLVEELGGERSGVTSRIDIEAVDEPVPDDRFRR